MEWLAMVIFLQIVLILRELNVTILEDSLFWSPLTKFSDFSFSSDIFIKVVIIPSNVIKILFNK
jgi:hypothetical protein